MSIRINLLYLWRRTVNFRRNRIFRIFFFDKSYANNYSAYYSDTFIQRDTLIQYRRAADKFFGFKKNMKIEISKPVNTPSPSALPINTVTYSPSPSPANTCTPATSQTEAPPSPTASVLPTPSPTPKPEYRAASAIEVLKSPFSLWTITLWLQFGQKMRV